MKYGIKFFAAAPIISPGGSIIGAACLMDKKAKQFSKENLEMLQDFASLAMKEIELRPCR